MQPKTKATLCFGLIGRWVYTKRNERIEKRARIKSNLRRP